MSPLWQGLQTGGCLAPAPPDTRRPERGGPSSLFSMPTMPQGLPDPLAPLGAPSDPLNSTTIFVRDLRLGFQDTLRATQARSVGSQQSAGILLQLLHQEVQHSVCIKTAPEASPAAIRAATTAPAASAATSTRTPIIATTRGADSRCDNTSRCPWKHGSCHVWTSDRGAWPRACHNNRAHSRHMRRDWTDLDSHAATCRDGNPAVPNKPSATVLKSKKKDIFKFNECREKFRSALEISKHLYVLRRLIGRVRLCHRLQLRQIHD